MGAGFHAGPGKKPVDVRSFLDWFYNDLIKKHLQYFSGLWDV
jgi:hypothetical protein